MKEKLQIVILYSAILIWVAGYNFWYIAWHNFFYHCIAVTWFLLYLLIRLLSQNQWLKIGANIGFLYSINNLLDEVFFNPKSFDLNEYIFCFIGTLIIIINGKYRRKGAIG